MPSSYTSLIYHIAPSTMGRKPLLNDSLREDIYKQISGIVKNKDGRLIQIGGIEDHVHILTTCSPKIALTDFVRDIKANASRWVNQQSPSRTFAWQAGYGAFTVSVSQVDLVCRYIQNQAEHHRRQSFATEFRRFLAKHNIEFDESRLFDDEFHG